MGDTASHLYRKEVNVNHISFLRKPKPTYNMPTACMMYDLPTTEQAIKWMHVVCIYTVKSTWLAAVEVGNFVDWCHYLLHTTPISTILKLQKPNVISTNHAKCKANQRQNQTI